MKYRRTLYSLIPFVFILLAFITLLGHVSVVTQIPIFPESLFFAVFIVFGFGCPVSIIVTWLIGRNLQIDKKRKLLIRFVQSLCLLVWLDFIVLILIISYPPKATPSQDGRAWQEYQLELASTKLRKGMTKDEVISIVGCPDWKHDTSWTWRAAEDTNDQSSFSITVYELNITFSNEVVIQHRVGWGKYIW